MDVKTKKILKVSELNLLSKRILEANFSSILVEGEISNLVEPSSGHIYFSLKDETAQVRAVMFRYVKNFLKFQPKNGAQVVITAQVSLYEARGDYQLIVSKMELAGAGVLHARFLQLKEKLEQEGLFAAKYKKPLPQLPQSIGVITSPTGAVIRDILSVIRRRFKAVTIIIYPVQVQGESAASQVAQALTIANLRNECDVLILARGGGSLEDLWPFNEEIVARAIFASNIPLVSAVGHETDFTIADFVADVRAPTPSVAAELVVPDMSERLRTLVNLKRHLMHIMQNKLHNVHLALANLKHRLPHPRYYVAEKSQRLDEIERHLTLIMRHQIIYFKDKVSKIMVALDAVNPLATLKRGYAVISQDGKVVKKISDVMIGDQIAVQVSDGVLQCCVQNLSPNK